MEIEEYAVKVENVSKKFLIGENKTYPTLRDKVVQLFRSGLSNPITTKEYWALKNVSFEIKRGEVVGVIGRNGAGKSTLLKILARITEPTTGKIVMRGRIASMLEVGTGFNPELTGRENIFLNGAIIGMTKAEIKSKFDEIVEFSGVGKFLDTPVKHYSSGMYIRLAFAVSAHLDTDILLVDEVLAVGDMEFQKKCLGKMSELAQSGRTVIFVSHNVGAVAQMCNTTILMSGGKVISMGKTQAVLNKYVAAQEIGNLVYKKANNHNHAISLRKVKIVAPRKDKVIYYEDPLRIDVTYDVNKSIDNVSVWIALQDQEGNMAFTSCDYDTNPTTLGKRSKGTYTDSIEIPGKMLNLNTYTLIAGIVRNNPLEVYDREEVLRFQIFASTESSKKIFILGARRGSVQPLLTWTRTITTSTKL